KYGISLRSVESWYAQPKFIDYWANELKELYEDMPAEERDASCLIVSAHSLPERIIQMGDPYPRQLKETAELIVKEANLS
ncbi:ferrochelatase, partial [Acinetobacter baumannii]|uniref:ferrochelatase n=1 Tax=Acinetobacter baumannii TaxID=470 RepID=UPI0024B7528B